MKLYSIYRITNKITNQSYIGMTNNFRRRMMEHFTPHRMKKYNYPLAEAIKEYGRNNFYGEIIYQSHDKSHAETMEIYFIKEYGYYNAIHLAQYNVYFLNNIKTNQNVKCYNLSEFCKNNNLDITAMSRVVNGIRKSHKNWTGSKMYK
jgi:group I intron endonuclease